MKKPILIKTISITIWLCLWQFAAICIAKPIFLPGPKDTLLALGRACTTSVFWKSVGNSTLSITLGLLTGTLTGIILALIASVSPYSKAFWDVPVKIIKAIPVASFIILVLLFVNSKRLSVIISALIVIPVIYNSITSGIVNADKELIELAKVFRLPFVKKIIFIYIPAVLPSFAGAFLTATGFAWKSGIAAEVIGNVKNSIGNNIYQAKIYLETDQLFAWTLVLILLSIIFEGISHLIIIYISKKTGGKINVNNK